MYLPEDDCHGPKLLIFSARAQGPISLETTLLSGVRLAKRQRCIDLAACAWDLCNHLCMHPPQADSSNTEPAASYVKCNIDPSLSPPCLFSVTSTAHGAKSPGRIRTKEGEVYGLGGCTVSKVGGVLLIFLWS